MMGLWEVLRKGMKVVRSDEIVNVVKQFWKDFIVNAVKQSPDW